MNIILHHFIKFDSDDVILNEAVHQNAHQYTKRREKGNQRCLIAYSLVLKVTFLQSAILFLDFRLCERFTTLVSRSGSGTSARKSAATILKRRSHLRDLRGAELMMCC